MNQVNQHAVVFAYHDVGVYCLQALLDAGMHIDLVITHDDDPNENIWFGSVAKLCQENHIPYEIVERDQLLKLLPRLIALSPDYIFSFYYRFMIPAELLKVPKLAALNMHGSLLPKYRGRAPVNWAVLHGEVETGATLHVMEAKPDAGDIVDQIAVSIEIHETAHNVFNKVSNAAKRVIERVLPKLMKGEIPRSPNDLSRGNYYGGRKPEDGRIDWSQPAITIYNLIRAVAPPYPGAFTEFQGRVWILSKSSLPLIIETDLSPQVAQILKKSTPGLHLVDNRYFGLCGDGKVLELLSVEVQ